MVKIVFSLLGILLLPLTAGAASTLYIDITAQGSELTISFPLGAATDNWAVGTVEANDNVTTPFDVFCVQNDTSEAVEITIHGNEMEDAATGLAETWTLSSTGVQGANAFAMWCGINDTTDNWPIIIREHDDGSFVKLKYDEDTSLAASDNWYFGLTFVAPASSVGNEAMIMCDDAGSETDDADNGLTLIAAVAP